MWASITVTATTNKGQEVSRTGVGFIQAGEGVTTTKQKWQKTIRGGHGF